MEKMHSAHKLLLQIKKKYIYISWVFNAKAKSVHCSLFLKILEKHFCNLTRKKNFVKHIKNVPQHLSEKLIDY